VEDILRDAQFDFDAEEHEVCVSQNQNKGLAEDSLTGVGRSKATVEPADDLKDSKRSLAREPERSGTDRHGAPQEWRQDSSRDDSRRQSGPSRDSGRDRLVERASERTKERSRPQEDVPPRSQSRDGPPPSARVPSRGTSPSARPKPDQPHRTKYTNIAHAPPALSSRAQPSPVHRSGPSLPALASSLAANDRSREPPGYRSREPPGDRSREPAGDRGREPAGDRGWERAGDRGREPSGDRGRNPAGDSSREPATVRGREAGGDRGREPATERDAYLYRSSGGSAGERHPGRGNDDSARPSQHLGREPAQRPDREPAQRPDRDLEPDLRKKGWGPAPMSRDVRVEAHPPAGPLGERRSGPEQAEAPRHRPSFPSGGSCAFILCRLGTQCAHTHP
jgi:hypothetical protein